MRVSSQLLLTFLLNACWQIAFLAAAVALSARLLRDSARHFQHLLWVSALVLSFCLPLVTSAFVSSDAVLTSTTGIQESPKPTALDPPGRPQADEPEARTPLPDTHSGVRINGNLAALLLALYVLFLAYRSVRLFRAWQRTRRIKGSAHAFEPSDHLQRIIAECQTAFQIAPVSVLSSDTVCVPITIGVRKPLVILPEQLLREADADLLASAIGHEMVHVWRRDYLLNLIYEFLYLPLSFHPAAALVRRCINQTRELCCDGLVADRLLKADVYARSLVRLAGSAPPLRNLALTTTVGIADADILEVRIMSLLNRPESSVRGKKLLLIGVAVILALPCVAAAAFSFRFDLARQDPNLSQAQEGARQAREREEKERAESEEYKKGLALGQEEKKRRERSESDPQFREEMEAHQRLEREIMGKRQAELVRVARITMDQAIQIATSQSPGKVLECSLQGEHWEAPGKLAKDGVVFYHVVIYSADDSNPTTTHVLVNAIDGSVFKGERERSAISAGTLNSKAVTLPNPEYPDTARAAGASGSVTVEVTIDEAGNVVSAKAISGHPLLQAAAVSAARGAQFLPTKLNGEPVKVMGLVTYNFVAR